MMFLPYPLTAVKPCIEDDSCLEDVCPTVFVGDDGQLVGVVNGITQTFLVHAVAVVIDAYTQTAPHLLTP